MSKFIRLTQERTGDPVVLNTDHMVTVKYSRNIGTVITTSDGGNLTVQESVNEILMGLKQ